MWDLPGPLWWRDALPANYCRALYGALRGARKDNNIKYRCFIRNMSIICRSVTMWNGGLVRAGKQLVGSVRPQAAETSAFFCFLPGSCSSLLNSRTAPCDYLPPQSHRRARPGIGRHPVSGDPQPLVASSISRLENELNGIPERGIQTLRTFYFRMPSSLFRTVLRIDLIGNCGIYRAYSAAVKRGNNPAGSTCREGSSKRGPGTERVFSPGLRTTSHLRVEPE